jgi:hypothetical protein
MEMCNNNTQGVKIFIVHFLSLHYKTDVAANPCEVYFKVFQNTDVI